MASLLEQQPPEIVRHIRSFLVVIPVTRHRVQPPPMTAHVAALYASYPAAAQPEEVYRRIEFPCGEAVVLGMLSTTMRQRASFEYNRKVIEQELRLEAIQTRTLVACAMEQLVDGAKLLVADPSRMSNRCMKHILQIIEETLPYAAAFNRAWHARRVHMLPLESMRFNSEESISCIYTYVTGQPLTRTLRQCGTSLFPNGPSNSMHLLRNVFGSENFVAAHLCLCAFAPMHYYGLLWEEIRAAL